MLKEGTMLEGRHGYAQAMPSSPNISIFEYKLCNEIVVCLAYMYIYIYI